ncbi:unnamed protein product, partial [Gadus morhua 'NCC']
MSMSGELKPVRPRTAGKRASSTSYGGWTWADRAVLPWTAGRQTQGGRRRDGGGMEDAAEGTDFDVEYDSYQEDYYDRVYDYQRVPAPLHPLPHGPSQAKRPRSSSHSSGHRRSRDRTHSKLSRAKSTSSTPAKLRMEELQVIKRELTLIKTQIDGLLDSLDKMDTQKNNHKGSPLREDSPAGSPYPPSASSPEQSLPPLSPPSSRHRVQRESPELGEATDDEHHSISNHSSDLEEDM